MQNIQHATLCSKVRALITSCSSPHSNPWRSVFLHEERMWRKVFSCWNVMKVFYVSDESFFYSNTRFINCSFIIAFFLYWYMPMTCKEWKKENFYFAYDFTSDYAKGVIRDFLNISNLDMWYLNDMQFKSPKCLWIHFISCMHQWVGWGISYQCKIETYVLCYDGIYRYCNAL